MHARVIESLLTRCSCLLVVVDQFADEAVLRQSLMQKGKQVKVTQRTQAEADLAVAAASIVARARFLTKLEKLSELAGVKLPKGAGSVIEPAKEVVARRGQDFLTQAAKLHFRVTQAVLEG